MSRTNWTSEKLFHRLLNNKTERTRWDIVTILFKRPTQDVFDRCMQLTYSESPKERRAGIDVLSQLGSDTRPFYAESIKRFFELLESETDPEMILTVLFAIGKNHDDLTKIQVDKICDLADTDNHLIKQGVVDALLFVEHKRAIDMQIKMSTDKLGYIRDWATFSLGQMYRNNKKIRAALWARINDKHSDTRFEALTGLAAKKDKGVKDLLMHELLNTDYSSSFMDAIEAFGDKEFLPILQQHYDSASADETTDKSWLRSLEFCIDFLSKK